MGRLIKATSSSTESRFVAFVDRGTASVFPRIADFPAIAPPFLEFSLFHSISFGVSYYQKLILKIVITENVIIILYQSYYREFRY